MNYILIYVIILVANIIFAVKRKDDGRWVNIAAVIFMIMMAFVIDWDKLLK